jgi:exodeoxyribonuclease VII small subunit
VTDDASRYDAMTFEQIMDELESLTDRMAAGDIGIEEAAELYEEAGRLHAQAAERLDRVQKRVEELAQPDD